MVSIQASGKPGFQAILEQAVTRAFGPGATVEDLRLVPGGASRETWSLTVRDASGATRPLILRRDPDDVTMADVTGGIGSLGLDRATERLVLEAAVMAGVPAPRVAFAIDKHAYVMERVAGETSARKILTDPAFARARDRLTADCGRALARLHATPAASLPPLPTLDAVAQINMNRALMMHFGCVSPTFELALRWLEKNIPPTLITTLVHGDFRLGNLMVGPDGLVAALDWELAHLGDPAEDLGWLCVRSWRFGGKLPVGGFGRREDLLAAYNAIAPKPVPPFRAFYWEVLGTLKWGVICLIQAFTHLRGHHRSVELAAIGRRVSETEYDLLNLLAKV